MTCDNIFFQSQHTISFTLDRRQRDFARKIQPGRQIFLDPTLVLISLKTGKTYEVKMTETDMWRSAPFQINNLIP